MRETSQENNGSGTGLRRFVLAGAAALALIAAAASTAQAAGPAPGPPGLNPDNRRFEIVSPQAKGGIDTAGVSYKPAVQASADGNSIVYTSAVAFAGSKAGGFPNYYLAKRDPGSGWSTTPISPPWKSTLLAEGGANSLFFHFTEDLSRGVAFSNVELAPASPPLVPKLFIQDVAEQTYDLITSTAPSPADSFLGTDKPIYFDATPDLSHVVFMAEAKLTDDAPANPAMKVYESVNGAIRLVTKLPGEIPVGNFNASAGASSGAWNSTEFRRLDHHAISDDGSRVFFTVLQSEGGTAQAFAGNLYARLNGSATRHISSDARFLGATPSGSHVAYRMVPPGYVQSGLGRLMLQDVDSGATQELAPDNQPADGSNPEVGRLVDISDDLDYIYFQSPSALVAGQQLFAADHSGLYLTHEGEVTLVATLDDAGDRKNDDFVNQVELDSTSGWRTPVRALSSDGTKLAFTTARQVDDFDSGGVTQVYLYDAETDQLECVSCPANGVSAGRSALSAQHQIAFSNMLPNLQDVRNFSDDGQRLFFETANRLVPEDTNGTVDVYVWQDGAPQLLSSGTSQFAARFLDASSDGDTAFISTRAQLVGHDRDDLADVYSVRGDGGFPEPDAPSPACEGDDCQAAAVGPPEVQSPASGRYVGPGNPSRAGSRASCKRLFEGAARKRRQARKAKPRQALKLRKQSRRLKQRAAQCRRGRV